MSGQLCDTAAPLPGKEHQLPIKQKMNGAGNGSGCSGEQKIHLFYGRSARNLIIILIDLANNNNNNNNNNNKSGVGSGEVVVQQQFGEKRMHTHFLLSKLPMEIGNGNRLFGRPKHK
jgi:hypothetical protein